MNLQNGEWVPAFSLADLGLAAPLVASTSSGACPKRRISLRRTRQFPVEHEAVVQMQGVHKALSRCESISSPHLIEQTVVRLLIANPRSKARRKRQHFSRFHRIPPSWSSMTIRRNADWCAAFCRDVVTRWCWPTVGSRRWKRSKCTAPGSCIAEQRWAPKRGGKNLSIS
jgi:hypothetical protein